MRFEPQKLIEGSLIAGYAVNAHICYIYIRGEYNNEGKRLQEAIDQAYKKTYSVKTLAIQVGTLTYTFIMELALISVEKKLLY